MTTRRTFICHAMAAVTLPSTTALWQMPAPSARPGLGLIMSVVRKQMAADPEGTLAKIRSLGYRTLEYSGTFGLPAGRLRQLVRRNRLVSLAAGGSMWEFMNHLPRYIEHCRQLEKKYLVCYWPWPDSGKNKTIADWRATCQIFNDMGHQCRKAGIRLAYHNHDIEFSETEGQVPYDIVLQHTDPALVAMMMDIWWVAKGGHDPMAYIEKHPGRFELCHIKTAERLARDPDAVPVDYPRILAQSKKAGFRHRIVENDQESPDPFLFLKDSAAYLDPLSP